MADVTRRDFLATSCSGLLAASAYSPPRSGRLLIDTHVEVWALDPKYPFRHPERPDLRVDEAAPIENQVAQMRRLRPEVWSADQPALLRLGQLAISRQPPPLSQPLRRPRPDRPARSARRRPAPVLGHRTRLPGHAVQPALPPRLHLAELQGPLPALARGGAAAAPSSTSISSPTRCRCWPTWPRGSPA